MTDITSLKIPPAVPLGQSTPPRPAQDDKAQEQKADKPASQDAKAEQHNHPDPLNRAAAIIERHFQSIDGAKKRLTLEKNEDAGVVVYRAIDRDTGEVIKQFPPDSLLKLLSYYRSHHQGLSVDNRV